MSRPSTNAERRFLAVSAACNLLLGCLGVTFAIISSSQAIMLDGIFNLSYFVAGLVTIRIASLVAGGDDERFPHGYAFFEPFVNGVKGTLVLGISVMAIVGAVGALVDGGRFIEAGPAVGYGVAASFVCWAMAYISRRAATKASSPLVHADMENWFVNAAISSCVLLAFAAIFAFERFDVDEVVPYVDPTVVLAVVAVTLGVPVRMAWTALLQLLNRAPAGGIVDEVTAIVDSHFADLPVQERFVRVTQPGRQRMVLVHVVLPDDARPYDLSSLDEVRARTHAALAAAHVATILDMLFTTDRRWGAPLSQGGIGGPSGPVESSDTVSSPGQ